MVGLVIVSHSRKICEGIDEMIKQMVSQNVRYKCVGGGEKGELGVNVSEIVKAITEVMDDEGVIAIADFGSTVIGVKAALRILSEEIKRKVFLSNAPIVEGSFTAAVEISIGKAVNEVLKSLEESKNMIKFLSD